MKRKWLVILATLGFLTDSQATAQPGIRSDACITSVTIGGWWTFENPACPQLERASIYGLTTDEWRDSLGRRSRRKMRKVTASTPMPCADFDCRNATIYVTVQSRRNGPGVTRMRTKAELLHDSSIAGGTPLYAPLWTSEFRGYITGEEDPVSFNYGDTITRVVAASVPIFDRTKLKLEVCMNAPSCSLTDSFTVDLGPGCGEFDEWTPDGPLPKDRCDVPVPPPECSKGSVDVPWD